MVIDFKTFKDIKEVKVVSSESFQQNEAVNINFFPCSYYMDYLTRRLILGEKGIMYSKTNPYIVLIERRRPKDVSF